MTVEKDKYLNKMWAIGNKFGWRELDSFCHLAPDYVHIFLHLRNIAKYTAENKVNEEITWLHVFLMLLSSIHCDFCECIKV